MPTNFLWSTGVNGLVVSAFNIVSSEIASLANSAGSTTGFVVGTQGSSGVITSTATAQAIWGELFYYIGSPGTTAAGVQGACLAGWWLPSYDGGVTFESSVTAPARGPDWLIPMSTTTIAASAAPFKAQGLVRLPSTPFRVLVQNNFGAALGGSSSAPFIKLAPVAMQY